MSRLWANAAGLLVGQSFVLWERGHAARLLILMRLWVRMPCPVQIRVPSVPSMQERFQP